MSYGSHNLRSLLGRYLGTHPTGSVATISMSFGQSIIALHCTSVAYSRTLAVSVLTITAAGLIAEALSFRSVPLCILPQGALLHSALGVSVGLLAESVEYEAGLLSQCSANT